MVEILNDDELEEVEYKIYEYLDGIVLSNVITSLLRTVCVNDQSTINAIEEHPMIIAYLKNPTYKMKQSVIRNEAHLIDMINNLSLDDVKFVISTYSASECVDYININKLATLLDEETALNIVSEFIRNSEDPSEIIDAIRNKDYFENIKSLYKLESI